VIPYYGYARQDRKSASRVPITAKLVADLIEAAGVTRVVSMDMHAGQIQGFFSIPFDHLYAAPVLLEHMRRRFDGHAENVVIVSPDAGGVERARAYSKRLGSTLGIVDKRRTKANVAEIMNVIGDSPRLPPPARRSARSRSRRSSRRRSAGSTRRTRCRVCSCSKAG
jgi:ribose-phosphate pyrophosphokinase